MDKAYLGESFEQTFTIYDARDETRTIDSATFTVTLNGTIVQSGALAIKPDGHTASFRFVAEHVGTHTITITWRMGDDNWVKPFLIEVVQA